MAKSLSNFSALGEAARSYAQAGWAVFPLRPRDKRPLISNWPQAATADLAQIEAWWNKNPNANIGCPTGACNGFWVLDVDGREGAEALAALEDHYRRLPATVQQKTGKGYQYFFAYEQAVRNSVGQVAPKIDGRGDGGYTVLPPSQHPDGPTYTWVDEDGTNLQPAPTWLITLVKKQAVNKGRADPIGAVIPEHQRNATLASLAGSMRHRGMGEEAMAVALLEVNRTQCLPPLDEDEVRSIAQSYMHYPPGEDRPPLRLVNGGASVEKSAPNRMPHLTDVGNAERLVAAHGEDLRHCPALGSWLVWDGQRWAPDGHQQVINWAKDVGRELFTQAGEIQGDEHLAARIGQWAAQSQRAHAVKGMVSLAESEPGIPAQASQFDRDSWLFGCGNGVLNLRTGQFQEAQRDDYLTQVGGVSYDPAARCPRWIQFLDEIMGGDTGLVDFLQKAVGYSLTGATDEQVFFILHGTGENGKGTLIDTITAVLGDYAITADPNTFMESKVVRVRDDLAHLRAARLVSTSETGSGQFFDEGLVKRLTGNDPIRCRFLYGKEFEYVPQFKIWLATNHKPTIKGTDHAIWRRIRLIPFTQTFSKDKRDNTLRATLATELSGILNWSLEGCQKWQEEGLEPPEAVTRATQGYREDQDVLADFIDARCILTPTSEGSKTELYNDYIWFCSKTNERPLGKIKFGERLVERGLDGDHRLTGKGREKAWRGIELNRDRRDAALMDDLGFVEANDPSIPL